MSTLKGSSISGWQRDSDGGGAASEVDQLIRGGEMVWEGEVAGEEGRGRRPNE